MNVRPEILSSLLHSIALYTIWLLLYCILLTITYLVFKCFPMQDLLITKLDHIDYKNYTDDMHGSKDMLHGFQQISWSQWKMMMKQRQAYIKKYLIFNGRILWSDVDSWQVITNGRIATERMQDKLKMKVSSSSPLFFACQVGFQFTLPKPENKHVKFNVDVKVQNDPERLFSLMHDIISAQPAWQTDLAPRILLGLWHPRFLQFAKSRLPYCRRSHIGVSTYIARKYFWNDCEAFSISFGALTTYDGQK